MGPEFSVVTDLYDRITEPLVLGIGGFNVVLAVLVLIVGFAAAILISRPFAEIITRRLTSHKYTGKKDKTRARGVRPLKTALNQLIFVIILMITLLLAAYSLIPNLDWTLSFKVFKDDVSIIEIIIVGATNMILYLFIILGLKPMATTAVSAIMSAKVKYKVEAQIRKSLIFWTRISLYHAMVGIAAILFYSTIIGYRVTDYISRFFIVSFIVSLTMVLMTILIAILKVTTLSEKRMEPQASYAIERVIKLFILVIGTVVGLAVIDFNYEILIPVLAVIGVALAFGIQDTIANLTAGLELAVDRPFSIGDRIRIGPEEKERWGDVVSIGLRSTSIITPEDEMVVIPNKVISSTEVWNFTKGTNIMADKIPISISYGSDWRLAKKLIVEAVLKHPYVLKTPHPHVHMKAFGNASIDMIIWVWIPDARDKWQIRSDILEMVKDSFDSNGVEIPFPYRTIVYKNDLPQEARFPEEETFRNVRRYPSKGKEYYETRDIAKRFRGSSEDDDEELPHGYSTDSWKIPLTGGESTLLVAARNTATAGMLAEFSIKIAHKLGANVYVLFVMERRSKRNEEEAIEVLEVFERVGRAYGVNVATLLEHGDALTEIISTVETRHVDVVVLGESKREGFNKWLTGDFASTIINRTGVPVITMPYRKELMEPVDDAEPTHHANM